MRALILGGLLLVSGVAIQAMPKVKLEKKSEKWMETKVPNQVGRYTFTPSPNAENPAQSYKMDERTYTELQNPGIVGRVYADNDKAFDVLLIAGNDKNCFHDNRVCFRAQGLDITKEESITLDTPRAKIPATMLTMKSQDRGMMRAIWFYKGPTGEFFAIPQFLTASMAKQEFFMSNKMDAVFYRIMPTFDGCSDEELIDFAKQYVVAADKSSGGFF